MKIKSITVENIRTGFNTGSLVCAIRVQAGGKPIATADDLKPFIDRTRLALLGAKWHFLLEGFELVPVTELRVLVGALRATYPQCVTYLYWQGNPTSEALNIANWVIYRVLARRYAGTAVNELHLVLEDGTEDEPTILASQQMKLYVEFGPELDPNDGLAWLARARYPWAIATTSREAYRRTLYEEKEVKDEHSGTVGDSGRTDSPRGGARAAKPKTSRKK